MCSLFSRHRAFVVANVPSGKQPNTKQPAYQGEIQNSRLTSTEVLVEGLGVTRTNSAGLRVAHRVDAASVLEAAP